MSALFVSLYDLIVSLIGVASALVGVILPWTPLIAWIVFWLFAVDWVKLREIIAKGGWIGFALIGAIMILVWGNIAPGNGSFDFYGLKVSNFVEKTVYVSGLFVIMFLAGALQLSGFCSQCMDFSEPAPAETHGHGHDAHGHDTHGDGDHGHDSHGGHDVGHGGHH